MDLFFIHSMPSNRQKSSDGYPKTYVDRTMGQYGSRLEMPDEYDRIDSLPFLWPNCSIVYCLLLVDMMTLSSWLMTNDNCLMNKWMLTDVCVRERTERWNLFRDSLTSYSYPNLIRSRPSENYANLHKYCYTAALSFPFPSIYCIKNLHIISLNQMAIARVNFFEISVEHNATGFDWIWIISFSLLNDQFRTEMTGWHFLVMIPIDNITVIFFYN